MMARRNDRPIRWSRVRNARGFSIIAAIAILVILAVLGTFIVSVTGGQNRGLALDLLGSRAYQAARTGIEWNAYRIYNPELTASPTPYDCTATPTTTITGLSGTLADFTVTVSCSINTYTESGNTIRVFKIDSTACNNPAGGTCPNNASTSPVYVERQVTAVFATCRLPSGGVC